MKKFLLTFAAAVMTIGCYAFPKALYVKKGDTFTKFNFGVAEDLNFSEDGRYLHITGYNETIDLDVIDYITFTAPTATTALTPDAQKERLISIADKVNEMAVPEKEADMINLLADFLADGGEYESSDGYIDWHAPVCNYSWPAGFWGEKNNSGAAAAMMKSVRDAVNMDGNSGVTMMGAALNLYRFAEYTGIFTADPATESWTKTGDADYLELRYRRVNHTSMTGYYAVRLEASDDFWVFDTSDFKSQVPRKLTATFWKNGDQLGLATIDFDIVQNNHIYADINVKGKVVEVKTSIKVTDDAMEAKAVTYIEGKYLNDSYSKLNGYGFMDYDMMKADYNAAQDYEDETTWETIEGDHERLNRHFLKATAETDIINELQGYGYIFDYKNYLAAQESADKSLEGEEFVYPDGHVTTAWPEYNLGFENGIINLSSEKEADRAVLVNYLNRKSDIQFAYDKTAMTQGFVTWEVQDETDDSTIPSVSDTNTQQMWGYYLKGENAYRIYYNEVTEYIEPTEANPNFQEIVHKFYGEYEYDQNGKPVIHSIPVKDLVFPVVEHSHYFNITPKLVFSDLTGFYFGDYFTKQAFSGPVGHYNRLIDAYFTITGIERNTSSK